MCETPRRPLRLRFGTRWLIVAMTVLAFIAAVVGLEYQQYRRQRRLASRIEDAGGTSYFGPGRLWRELRAIDLDLGSRASDHFHLPALDDRLHLEQWQRIESLESVTLRGAALSEDDLRALVRCRGLRYLDLAFCNIDDDRLQSLASLASLDELDLTQTQVTEQGIARFAQSRPEVRIYDD